MLREYKHVRQIEGEAPRRWFADKYFDLIVWFDNENHIVGFQLCYDIFQTHRALTWRQETGYSHHRVDDGESRPGKMKASPILVSDGVFDYRKIAEKFKKESQEIETPIAMFVYKKLMEYPG